jgi:hypothetical protein
VLRSRASIVVMSSARISIGCRWSRRAWRVVIELDGASGSRQVHELDGGQDLDRRPVIPEAVAVVIELTRPVRISAR